MLCIYCQGLAGSFSFIQRSVYLCYIDRTSDFIGRSVNKLGRCQRRRRIGTTSRRQHIHHMVSVRKHWGIIGIRATKKGVFFQPLYYRTIIINSSSDDRLSHAFSIKDKPRREARLRLRGHPTGRLRRHRRWLPALHEFFCKVQKNDLHF